MTPAPKPRRISREEEDRDILRDLASFYASDSAERIAINRAIRALKREQKAADAKKKDKRRTR